MSFSLKVKNELSRIIETDRFCMLSELAALIHMTGIIQLSGLNRISLKLVTENPGIARKIFILIKKLFGIQVQVSIRKNRFLNKTNSYQIFVPYQLGAEKILEEVYILKKSDDGFDIEYGIPKKLLKKICCKRAYIRGAFLGGGSLSDPEKNYHLEFVTQSIKQSEDLSRLINNSFKIRARIISRKNNHVVYIKEGDAIVDLLNVMGAHNSLMELENIRIYKEMRNNVNRLVNCETANLNKTVETALRQIEKIEYIRDTMGLEKLPENLREIAELRLLYKESSLKELGEMLDPPVSKSCVNYRLKKLEKIAENLIEKNNKKPE